jgi:glycosyltransferase involved in cell wall biosynthesis
MMNATLLDEALPAQAARSVPTSAATATEVRPASSTTGPDRTWADHVVHLVGRLSRDEGNLLWPTVLALANSGVSQSVVLGHAGDADFARRMLPQSVRVLHPAAGLFVAGRDVDTCLHRELGVGPVLAVHLYGLGAARRGLRVLRDLALKAPVFLHLGIDPAAMTNSRRWLSSLMLRGLVGRSDRHLQIYVVHSQHVSPISSLSNQPSNLLGRPVREAYFAVKREEAAEPLIVTSGRADDLALAQAFSQIAVLLAGSRPRLHFAWVGPCSAAVRQVLQAAQVRIERAPTSTERAAVMASAWLYLVPDAAGADGVPLAQAMAVGLPCVVADTPGARDLIIDRLSGLVCRDRSQLLDSIALLVDAQLLRRMFGHAARGRARHQAGRHRFRASLLLAHGLPCPGVH